MTKLNLLLMLVLMLVLLSQGASSNIRSRKLQGDDDYSQNVDDDSPAVDDDNNGDDDNIGDDDMGAFAPFTDDLLN